MEDELETRILEINLISAQNLKTPQSMMMMRRRMHTYTLAWVDANAKLRSDLDRLGGENPTWNDKFIFRVSQDFINDDTSGVQFQIYAVGYIRDYFIGTVRYILSSTPTIAGVPAFSALHIRRPSGRVHGILNIAATVYHISSHDFPSLTGISSAVCVRDLIGKNNKNERRLSCCLNHVGSETSTHDQQSSEDLAESSNLSSCELESVYFSDGTDSKTSSSAAASFTTITAFREGNTVGSNLVNKNWISGGVGGLLCGLVSQRVCNPLLQIR